MFRPTRTVADSRDFVVLLCRIIDLDPLIRDRRRTILFYACFIYPFFFHSFTLYTLYYHRNDIQTFLKCISIWGAAGQCSFKTINAYIYQKRIRKIFDMITYKQTESENDAEIHEMYLKWAKRLSVLLKLLFYTLTLNIIFFSLYAFLGIVLGSPQFIFVLNIPGFNTDPKAGFPDYEIQLLYQLGALVIGVYEVIALDGLIAYFILSGVSMGDSIIVTIQRMSTAVLDERTSSEDTAEAIKRIIQLHWEYLSYINNLDEMYNGMFLMQFGSFAFSGSVAMYAGRSTDYFALYSIVLTSLFQLFFYNSLGSIIETKNQDIAFELYNTNWFYMSLSNRKKLLLMLQRAQTVKALTVGHLAPLNLETGMSIYKTLYSYFLLLKDAFN
ncbi:odorant receptor 30a-like [Lutzomyia longipalpis]|uniref:odorant receptor 30a-like n=1 Tax=Lutzomyia longipalpis TaxID=7200 RepID=UPI0024845E35|nr:odorant receptor 30a-like [Lutzomyia longipalpis]